MEIRTERLVLRDLRPEDAPAIAAACSDPDVPRFIPLVPSPYGRADAEAFLTDPPERSFAITEPPADELIGIVTVRPEEGAPMGYWLARRARGRGLMTEAVVGAVRWSEEQGIRRLTLRTHPENRASQRVAEKAGFVQLGVFPHDPPFRDGTAVGFLYERDTRPVSDRLAARVRRDFGEDAQRRLERLATLELPLAEKQSRERIQAAIVLAAAGDADAFDYAVSLAERDWRDVLVGAGLGNGDWPARLTDELGPH
jgi:RimJ/RimL family protein N-acetyltransferase